MLDELFRWLAKAPGCRLDIAVPASNAAPKPLSIDVFKVVIVAGLRGCIYRGRGRLWRSLAHLEMRFGSVMWFVWVRGERRGDEIERARSLCREFSFSARVGSQRGNEVGWSGAGLCPEDNAVTVPRMDAEIAVIRRSGD